MKNALNTAPQELKWIVPFLCLGAIALTTARTEPVPPLPQGARVVVDTRGKEVPIELPFRGSVLTRGTEVTGYLVGTRAPETLLAATAYKMGDRVRNHIIGDIFPEVVNNPRIWASEGISDTRGPKVEIERMLQFDPGVFMGWYTLAEPFERVGIPFIGFRSFPATEEELGYSVRIYSRVVGTPERGEAIVARHERLNRELGEELADKYPSRKDLSPPRYLYVLSHDDSVVILGAKNHYTRFFAPHAEVVSACDCPYFFSTVDPERLHLYDPDIIVLGPQPGEQLPDEFVRDPRWQGLTAVKNRRVYRAPPGIDYFIAAPFWSRWLAELSHERLEPKVRNEYRDYVDWLFDYELSTAELDIAFAVADNRAMAKVERFQARESRE